MVQSLAAWPWPALTNNTQKKKNIQDGGRKFKVHGLVPPRVLARVLVRVMARVLACVLDCVLVRVLTPVLASVLTRVLVRERECEINRYIEIQRMIDLYIDI